MNQSTSKLLGYRLATPVAKSNTPVVGGYDAEKQVWVASSAATLAGGTFFLDETFPYLGLTVGDWQETPPSEEMPEGDQERFVEDDYGHDWVYGIDC